MKIIAGLGNPGPKYETTRHNVGFLAIDRLIERWGASGPIQKFNGEIYQATVRLKGADPVTVYLAKPQTYMNNSGQCIAPLFKFYRANLDDLVIIHDDLALPPLSLRLKTGGGTGGHNGLKSIDACLGQTNYHRIRMGIGHPSTTPGSERISPADFVLQQFRDDELRDLDVILDDVGEAAEKIFMGQIHLAMNQYHRSKQE